MKVQAITRDDKIQQTYSIKTSKGSSFGDEIKGMIKEVDNYQKEADKVMEEGATKGIENLHEALIRLQEAEISFRFFMQIRNKALEAYREIMRMQT